MTSRSHARLPATLARFALSGGGVAIVAVFTYHICATILGIAPLVANLVAYLVQFMLGYHWHRTFSFAHGPADGAGRARYCATSLGAFGLNSLWVWILAYRLSCPPWTPIIPMVTVTPLVTFCLARYWVFPPRDGAV